MKKFKKLVGVDGPERSGTPLRYLLFSRNTCSGTYCQISWNDFYLPFRHLFTMGGDDDYEFTMPHILYSDVIDKGTNKSFVQ